MDSEDKMYSAAFYSLKNKDQIDMDIDSNIFEKETEKLMTSI